MDNLVREYFNTADKAVMKMYNGTGLRCAGICTGDNYSRLMQAAENPSVYYGYADIDSNKTDTHHIAKQGLEIVKTLQHKLRAEAIDELKEAAARGNVLTDLQEIYQASIDGRGDLLMVCEDYAQPVC